MKDGRIIRAGGRGLTFDGYRTFIIDPETLSAQRVGDLNSSRWAEAVLGLADGRVLAAGGASWGMLSSFDLKTAELFDPQTGQWKDVASMNRLSGLVGGVPLRDGRAMVGGYGMVEIYDAVKDQWASPPGLQWRDGAGLAVLPSGLVVISGGNDKQGQPSSEVTVFDPRSGAVRSAKRLATPRAGHAVAVLPNGRVLALGGRTTGNVPTATVEEILWEPTIPATLAPGFYVATSAPVSARDGGFAGIEVNSGGRMDGGLDFGGTLPAGGRDVGFGGFYLPEAQTVRGSVDFQPTGSGTFEVTVRLLDVNKQPEAAPILGGTHIEFTQALPAGFHVIELQSGDRSPPATYQFALNAAHLAGGAVAGGVLDPALGAPGFVAFYLPDRQDVTIRLYNENTYGSPRGAGEVILTLYDSTGKVIARSGPGAAAP
jgi:hypothetical protein